MAWAFILAPLGNLLFTLFLLKIPNWYHPSVWLFWVRGLTWMQMALQGLLFLSGLSLLMVRKHSWMIALVTLAIVSIYNILSFENLAQLGQLSVIFMILFTLITLFFLLFSPFRRPYLNPRLRWWESSPRFKTEIKVVIEGSPEDIVLVDVSQSGALIEFKAGQQVPELEGFKQMTLSLGPILSCVITRRTERGYGLRFVKLSRASKKYLRNWLRELAQDPSRFTR